ncbi:MAG: hypothetical protein ABT00_09065 [Bordetella sp. SCN 68-11]|nr:MAG: hypothetical protein ABT00_09065 [Bordetella sp. SCN 68-11]OJX33871.1 MAG: hypothetical protein BGO75_14955 [Burkholderiales bacterium 68-20]
MIDRGKYDRTVTLHCPTCGGTDFKYEAETAHEDSALITCPSCGLTITKSDLIASNGENIDAHLDEVKAEVMQDITKSLRDAFKGNKFIKLK